MEPAPVNGQPCYSARLTTAFLAVLRDTGIIPEPALRWFAALDPDERVHVSAVHTMLEATVKISGDELLGVKAAARSSIGDVGIFDFVLSSAATLRAALDNAGRYMRLLNDTLTFTLEVSGDRAIARFENSVVLPRSAEDFQTCGFISTQVPSWPEGMLDDMDVWFRYAPPPSLDAYREVLGPARLHFHSPMSGFGFPARLLDEPLRGHDPKLHEVLRRYAESTLAALPQRESVTEKVRRYLVERLATGDISLEQAARTLRMSSRTLGRRLSEEGTTFKNLVDDTRRAIALRYVAGHDLGLSEVALLSGFTETPSFYRAFRRWTGMTPTKYRWTHSGDLRGLR
jgi:AraC-like DNA-binding protein